MRTDDEIETTSGGRAGPPERPWWPVALAIGACVAIVIVVGFYANAHLRSPVGPEATATVAGQPAVSAPPVPSPTTVPTIAPTPSVATSATSGAAGSAVLGTATPIIVLGSTTFFHYAASPEDQEIEKAYLHYWQVVSAAELNDDPSHLEEVMDEPQLALIGKYIQSLKAQGRSLKVDVKHKPLGVSRVASNQVQVFDEYVNSSLYVDLKTNQVVPTKERPQIMKFVYVLKKVDGTWKVTDGVNVTG